MSNVWQVNDASHKHSQNINILWLACNWIMINDAVCIKWGVKYCHECQVSTLVSLTSGIFTLLLFLFTCIMIPGEGGRALMYMSGMCMIGPLDPFSCLTCLTENLRTIVYIYTLKNKENSWISHEKSGNQLISWKSSHQIIKKIIL